MISDSSNLVGTSSQHLQFLPVLVSDEHIPKVQKFGTTATGVRGCDMARMPSPRLFQAMHNGFRLELSTEHKIGQQDKLGSGMMAFCRGGRRPSRDTILDIAKWRQVRQSFSFHLLSLSPGFVSSVSCPQPVTNKPCAVVAQS